MALDISGEYRMAIAKQRVWDALNDPAVLQKCIAGCRSLEKVADNEFNAIVVAKVGPISAIFKHSHSFWTLSVKSMLPTVMF